MSELFNLPVLMQDAQISPLPDPEEISYYVLEKDRKIYLDYEVSEAVLAIERMILRWNMEDKDKPVEERKPIILYIMSYGGDLDYMWSLIGTMEASVTPIYTVNMGVAASAASLIFLTGTKRFMLPRSKIIIHEGSASMSGDAVKVMDATESYKKAIKAMKQYILSKSKISPTVLNKKRNNDWEIDAVYCLENGVCDIIISSINEII